MRQIAVNQKFPKGLAVNRTPQSLLELQVSLVVAVSRQGFHIETIINLSKELEYIIRKFPDSQPSLTGRLTLAKLIDYERLLQVIDGQFVSPLWPPTLPYALATIAEPFKKVRRGTVIIAGWKRVIVKEWDATSSVVNEETASMSDIDAESVKYGWAGVDTKGNELLRAFDGEPNTSYNDVRALIYSESTQDRSVIVVYGGQTQDQIRKINEENDPSKKPVEPPKSAARLELERAMIQSKQETSAAGTSPIWVMPYESPSDLMSSAHVNEDGESKLAVAAKQVLETPAKPPVLSLDDHMALLELASDTNAGQFVESTK